MTAKQFREAQVNRLLVREFGEFNARRFHELSRQMADSLQPIVTASAKAIGNIPTLEVLFKVLRERVLSPPGEADEIETALIRNMVATIHEALDDPSPTTPAPVTVARPFDGDYRTYLASAQWAEYAAGVRRAWDYRCAINASHTGPIEVHHRTYERVGNEAPYDCVPLCDACHERFHHLLPAQRSLFDRQQQRRAA